MPDQPKIEIDPDLLAFCEADTGPDFWLIGFFVLIGLSFAGGLLTLLFMLWR